MREHNEQLDRVTRERLAKLASMPVDLSRLEQRMAGQLPPRQHNGMRKDLRPVRGWLRFAAVIALFAGVTAASYYAFFGVNPQAAIAQTMTVAQLHEHLINDPQTGYLAQSTDQAQALVDAQLGGKLPLPMVEGTRVESCCLVEGDFPLRAALVIKRPDAAVTIVIAQGDHFAHPMNPIDHASGIKLQGHEHAGIPMVMRNEGDLWMCVMGEAESQALADIAAGLVF